MVAACFKAYSPASPRRWLEAGLERCPSLVCALAQILLGVGMVLAVGLAVLVLTLPMWLSCLL